MYILILAVIITDSIMVNLFKHQLRIMSHIQLK